MSSTVSWEKNNVVKMKRGYSLYILNLYYFIILYINIYMFINVYSYKNKTIWLFKVEEDAFVGL
jgi:hypothetical protein